jgi:sec-independent protein translocase protein TatB
MFDIGWSEMAIIAAVALFVIGPRDLPKALRTVGRYAGKVRAMAREFQSSIDEAVRDTELEEVKNQIEAVGKLNVKSQIAKAIDPDGEMGRGLDVTGVLRGSDDKDKDSETAADSTGADPTGADAAAATPEVPTKPVTAVWPSSAPKEKSAETDAATAEPTVAEPTPAEPAEPAEQMHSKG